MSRLVVAAFMHAISDAVFGEAKACDRLYNVHATCTTGFR